MDQTEPQIALSEPVGDTVKTTTCYMCACRCGIKVHLRDGTIRYIEGNRDHPVNKGVLCAKGSAGIMQHYSPARLKAPLKRIGPRGSNEFAEISWDEALGMATDWLGKVRSDDPRKLAFFTGRDQSQALTGWFVQQFGTPNFAAHGGFCSVNMAAAGLYTFGGSFWEFGEPDWDHTRYFMMFGVAEDHGSNPIKAALGKLKARGVKIVVVNPVRTGYGAVADEWIGIKPGTDGLLVGAMIRELLLSEQVDLPSLVSHTNAGWLVINDPGASDDGLIVRDDDGKPQCLDKTTGALADATRLDVTPALSGPVTLADGRTALPVFQLLVERFLSDDYDPNRVEEATGVPAKTIRRLAQELAHAAFEEEIELDIPWTDWAGRTHPTTKGRPVSMHAMRGISAHANGFQTCRMLHLLQILLGTIDCPGGFRYKAPFPRPTPPPLKPAGKPGTVAPDTPMSGPPLGFPTAPEDLLVDDDGNPMRIDKAYSWDAPIAAHGLMHMVITNAANHDPYPVDVLFMYMANMSWNSSMNIPAVLQNLTAKDPATGEYKIPKIIYSDAYFSEMVPYADLILPDTTYLERWDCISMLDRPISDADAPADAIRQPVVEPDRNVRPFQTALLDLGARLKLPGFVDDDGEAKYPGGYEDYIVNHERAPGIGPLAGYRGADGTAFGKGAPNPKQLDQYIENGCFYAHHLKPEQRYYKHVNKAYLDWAAEAGFIGAPNPITFQLYLEPLQKFRLAAEGHGPVQPPDSHRARIKDAFDPLPFWYPVDADDAADAEFPMSAVTQRPMAMYHSWGSQNAWLRQIHTANRLYVNRHYAGGIGVEDDDWVWITSPIGRVKAQVRLMEGVNTHTVWTWNAIGKRRGAWNLDPQAPEATKGFLLNHLITELLPAREGGYRFANADPITGQAAWYDLKVRIEKAGPGEQGESWPRFEALKPLTKYERPDVLRFGGKREDIDRSTALPETTNTKLGLVIDLDTCVGCQACATSCKEWNTGGLSGPLSDQDPYGADPHGTWLNRIHGFEVGEGERSRTVHFPRSCLHCEDALCVTVCPTGASYKRAEDGIVLVDPETCIGCKLCSWACPYGAREYDYAEGVMKKCTLCVDRIYNETLPEEDRVPACVRACPVGARHFGDLGDPESDVSKLVDERDGYGLMPELDYKPVNRYLPPRPRRDQVAADAANLVSNFDPPGSRYPEPPAVTASADVTERFFRWADKMLTR